MIGSIIPVTQRPLPPVFNEGAGTSANRITAVVLSVLASLVSFLFLPAEGALLVSAGAFALLSMCCCFPSGPAPEGASARWYHPIVNLVPHLFHRPAAHVANFGMRGRGLDEFVPYPDGFNRGPNAVVAGVPVHDPRPRAQVEGGHRPAPFNGVAVMPDAWQNQAAAQPAVHHQPQGGPNRPHVPVGRANR